MVHTGTVNLSIDDNFEAAVRRGAETLDQGGLVAFRTETVYGVGARADLPGGMARLRDLKGRNDNGQPFTLHVGSPSQALDYISSVSPLGARLMRKGWPGPLTLIFQLDDASAAAVAERIGPDSWQQLYHENTIGIRCPDDNVAASLLQSAAGPIAAASANAPGMPPPTEARGIADDVAADIDLVLDAGPARYGQASTIVQLNGNGFRVLRNGVIEERTIARLATLNVLFVCTGNTCRSPMAAGLFRAMVAERLDIRPDEIENAHVSIQSAGISAGAGSRASSEAVALLAQRGIDISSHRSQPLTRDLIQQADAIYAMTDGHLAAIVALVPAAASRAVTISKNEPIDDPIGGSAEVYKHCADRIESCLRERLSEIL